jgi:PKD repeat protein
MQRLTPLAALSLLLAACVLAGCPDPPPGTPPAAAFTLDTTAGTAPLPVQFTDASLPGSAPILTWAWDFGDGRRSFLPSPAHTFLCPGDFTVSLTVVTAAGQSSASRAVLVSPGVITSDFCSNEEGEGDLEGEGEGDLEGEGDGGAEGEGEGEGEGDGEPEMLLTRSFPDGATYTPGEPLVVQLLLEYSGSGAVTALAVRETQPFGWTYAGPRPGTSSSPPIAPVVGRAGELEFAWVSTPAFPVTLEFAVQPPAGATGAQNLSAVIIYRKGSGELRSNTVTTTVQPAAAKAARMSVLLDAIAGWNASGGAELGPVLDAVEQFGRAGQAP